MNEATLQIFQSFMYSMITAVLPIVTFYIVKVLRTKLAQAEDAYLNAEQTALVEQAADIVSNIVLKVQQTFVDSLKRQGQFTKEAAIEAKTQAVRLANSLIAEELKEAVAAVYSSFDEWLDIQIEKNVYENK